MQQCSRVHWLLLGALVAHPIEGVVMAYSSRLQCIERHRKLRVCLPRATIAMFIMIVVQSIL